MGGSCWLSCFESHPLRFASRCRHHGLQSNGISVWSPIESFFGSNDDHALAPAKRAVSRFPGAGTWRSSPMQNTSASDWKCISLSHASDFVCSSRSSSLSSCEERKDDANLCRRAFPSRHVCDHHLVSDDWQRDHSVCGESGSSHSNDSDQRSVELGSGGSFPSFRMLETCGVDSQFDRNLIGGVKLDQRQIDELQAIRAVRNLYIYAEQRSIGSQARSSHKEHVCAYSRAGKEAIVQSHRCGSSVDHVSTVESSKVENKSVSDIFAFLHKKHLAPIVGSCNSRRVLNQRNTLNRRRETYPNIKASCMPHPAPMRIHVCPCHSGSDL